MKNDAVIHGHGLLAVERFQDDTRHLIVFDIFSSDSPIGCVGQRFRLFLSEPAYQQAQEAQRRKQLKIRRHWAVVEGHILPDKKRKGGGHGRIPH